MAIREKFFAGDGGINILAAVAFPVIVSEASETVMMFVDRLFLSSLTPTHMAAAMSGGLTCFMFMTLFFGILSYVNAMVAQHLGAGKKSECATVMSQAIILVVCFYPVLLCCRPLGIRIFDLFGHAPEQRQLAADYFGILIFGGVFALIKVCLASFFSGIGRTRVVMLANVAAMVVNIPANYILIFGKFGLPALGIRGAALGTVLGGAVGAGLLIAAYAAPGIRREFNTLSFPRLNPPMMRKLLFYGGPGGIEFLLNMMAFNCLIQVLHSYGKDVAAAVTIVFSWDMVSFIPLIGLNVGVMSLGGRYMGARQPDKAARTAYSGLAFVAVYAGVLSMLFFFFPHALIRVFTRGEGNFDVIVPLAVPMLRLVAMYVFSDGVYLVFSGLLKGAGDTRWSMAASVLIHWLLAGTAMALTLKFKLPILTTWLVIVLEILFLGIVFYLRFLGGKWRGMAIITPPGKPAAETGAPPNLHTPPAEGSWDG
ncbi:MAG: MATE family efflux transporter [Lentisphaeria bacterium]|nr:MATE family efflux transporter [Lentisphaeria bacterium]